MVIQKNDSNEKSNNVRLKWKKKIDFIFGVAGGSIGLGNVWRFPYLCYNNGGGAFLIPYLIFLVGAAVPIFFLEAAVGQLTSRAVSRAWDIVPLMRGIGYASLTIIMNLNTYYMTVLAWSMQYIIASFQSDLPWSSCENSWNTNSCYVFGRSNNLSITNASQASVNNSLTSDANVTKVSSVTEYWEQGVLGKTKGVHDLGSVRLELFACLVACWIIVYFSIWKGISWTSKIVYFTATFPLLMLLVIFVRGVTLPGAEDGIYFYLRPNVTKLGEPKVWMDAATQVFYSYSLSNGIMVAMGSYNTFHHNLYRDTVILSLLNSGTSFFAGFAVFSVLGFMANEQNSSIETVAESGPGLVFIAYPKAISLMPLPQLWGVLFFFMIFLLGLDSQFIGQESLIVALMDLKPKTFSKKYRREILVALVCFIQFMVGIIMVTEGGVYVFNMYDNYAAAGWCLFFIGVCECVTVSWLFGIHRFWNYICHMLKFRPFPWFKYAWCLFSPILTSAVLLHSLINYEPLTYNKTYKYPIWAQAFCWCLALCAILWIPGYAVYAFCKAEGSFKTKWEKVITMPEELKKRIEIKEESSVSNEEFSLPLKSFEEENFLRS